MREHGKCWSHEFVTLPYNKEKAVYDLAHSEFYEYAPYWCRITENLIKKGKPSHGAVLKKAMWLCKEETGSSMWYDIPDKFWEMALRNLDKGYEETNKRKFSHCQY